MDTCILNPQREKGEPKLPPTGILAVNPADARSFAACGAQFELQRHFLFHSTLYTSDVLFLAGPAVGAPMAVMTLEKLIALGAQNIICYGWAGSLQDTLHAMDILVPTGGISEEGTSDHYLPAPASAADTGDLLRNRLCAYFSDHGLAYQEGKVWTTDAPYRETRGKVEQYSRQGIRAVDMEYTALRAVAAFRHVQLAAVMLISDELLKIPWQPRYGGKSFKKRSAEMLQLLCGYVLAQGSR